MNNWKIINTSLFVLACLLSLESLAQGTPEDKQPDTIKVMEYEFIPVEKNDDHLEVFVVVEDMPEFPGGQDSMKKFIADSLVYPRSALDINIQGRVVVEFVVDEQGNITNAKVIKPLGWGLDEAALEVVNKMPKWKPGKQRGKPVKVRFVIPIRFALTADGPEEKPKEER